MDYNNDVLIDWFLYLDNQHKKNKKNNNIIAKKKEIQEICQQKIRNYNKIDCEIVIAKYNENLLWCNKYKYLATIYDKSKNPIKNSIQLPNVGRESHTYLYHIINNWDKLADNTLFTQGGFTADHNPFPLETYLLKKKKIKLFINLYYKGIDFRYEKGKYLKHRFKWLEEFRKGLMKPAEITFDQFWCLFNDIPIKNYDSIVWSHGAIFSISRELIKSRPLNLYIKLYNLVTKHINPEEGHYFERCWYYIFNSSSSNLDLNYNQELLKRAYNIEGTNIKDTNIKDTNIKDTNIKDTIIKDTNIKDTNIKDTNIKDTNMLESKDTKNLDIFTEINYLENDIDNNICNIKQLFKNNIIKIEEIENLNDIL